MMLAHQLAQEAENLANALRIKKWDLMFNPFLSTSVETNTHVININDFQASHNYDLMLTAVAHEMRHIYQLENGILVQDKDMWFWDGRFICSTHDMKLIQFHKRPWETDAIAFEREFAKNRNLKVIYRKYMDESFIPDVHVKEWCAA
jgi:hypothetical protein